MPSHLRLQSSFEGPIAAHATYRTSPTLPPAKKQKMSLTSTYYVASTARSKLGREASRADHDLRLLVGHANLLDHLMVELADAEREQEAWFNQSVRKASKPEEPRKVQWLDHIAEQYEEDDDDESDSDDELDDYEVQQSQVQDDDELEFDEDMKAEYLQLARTPSNKHSPPELTLDDSEDSDSESEDDMPTSPPDTPLPLSNKATTTYFKDFAMQQPQQPLIAAC